MDDQPKNKQFASSEELLRFLRERCDDIDSVVIPVQEGVTQLGPEGQRNTITGVGAIIRLCDGSLNTIHRHDAEMLINDGVLQRLRIKCVLDPLKNP